MGASTSACTAPWAGVTVESVLAEGLLDTWRRSTFSTLELRRAMKQALPARQDWRLMTLREGSAGQRPLVAEEQTVGCVLLSSSETTHWPLPPLSVAASWSSRALLRGVGATKGGRCHVISVGRLSGRAC